MKPLEADSIVACLTLMTDHGDLDVSYEPSGTEGYPDLVRASSPRDRVERRDTSFMASARRTASRRRMWS
jgi:hypothetical protein